MKMATRLLLLHKKNLKGKAEDYYEIRHICHPSPLAKTPFHCNQLQHSLQHPNKNFKKIKGK
jgi:hypothetical protein